jgi:pimeloyl-ACP methyl ester carboxylesterase
MPNAIFSAALLFLLLVTPLAGTPATPSPAYRPAACMFQVPASLVEGTDVTCGYLTVPSDHDRPDGPQLQLAVAILKHQGTLSRPEPLFVLQGGPGGSTLDVHPTLALNSSLLQHFDLVMLEQRGTLHSQPALLCPEADQYTVDTLNVDLTPAETNLRWGAVMQKCRDRLVAQGARLADFNSLQNARDVETLRVALGYGKIDLYGVSYGTLLVQHVMRLFPDSIRAVILDGVVPTQSNYIYTNVLDQDRVFKAFFQDCRESEQCSRDYPDLQKVFFQIVDRLDKSPAHITVYDQKTGISYPALMNGESFYSGVYQSFYQSGFIPGLPRAIYKARDGNYEGFDAILSFFTFDHTLSYGMYYSVNCAEKQADPSPTLDLRKVPPQIVAYDQGSVAAFQALCKGWDVPSLDPVVEQPVKSDLPVLLLSGGLDPVTPPANAALVAAALSHSFSYTFASGGHSQAFTNTCADNLIQRFLEDPSVAPDSTCVAGYDRVDFWKPADVVALPFFGRILNLDRDLLWPAGLLAFFCLGLLSTLLLIPLVWLVKVFVPKPAPVAAPATLASYDPLDTPQPPLGTGPLSRFFLRLAGLVAMLNSLLLPVYWIVLTVLFVQMSLDNNMMVVWGVPSVWRPLFLLPLLFLLLTVFMLGESFAGWRSPAWSIWRKVYYTLVTLSALGCVVVMVYVGAMFQLFQ